ncbi:hypothetical protein [Qiania dongpingensis]|uniref:Uncharacterized protein n=1 Tax=Qiania dongpingensis TaxID=2763669 RepID=A0A7G9G5P8_9FIRM|nr:hypothetical protein [Qiania dongpingensis]QNM06130.1 hypothetical protein H9Q78_02940 [Qiania dongpingensis]
MTLKLTERDKKLLVFLAAFVMVVGLGFGVLYPLLEKNQEKAEALAEAKLERLEKERKSSMLGDMRTKVDSMKEELSDTQKSFYEITPSMGIDKMLTGMALSSGLEVRDLDIVMPETGDYTSLTGYAEILLKLISQNSGGESASVYPGAYTADITMIMKGGREGLQSMLDACAAQEPKLRITEFYWQAEKEKEGQFTLSVSMELYMYEDIDQYTALQKMLAAEETQAPADGVQDGTEAGELLEE